ncbi:MAG: hypothetical protein CYPHOPRED_003412 [Cyphobasidiales sp. Tagirdzhanova-0007]|nr:MAG: hypothetical protein CYPHOPRED_003412 [Cyphobasidiales sp. Tagirdzhanova-0007]
MNLITKLKEKHELHKQAVDQERQEQQEKEDILEQQARAETAQNGGSVRTADAGAGAAVMSFGGGPRFDNSGPGPQVHDFEGADAEPQNLAAGRTEFGRMETGINEDPMSQRTSG